MSRLLHILSIALITAGLVLLAEIAVTLLYKEPLSSVYAAIQQNQAASELSETEARYPGRADRRAIAHLRSRKRRIATLARRFGAQAEAGEAIGRIRAPAMDGLSIVVVQGTDTASLQKGPGHYPETPFPGQGGTVGIAGHRTTYLAPFRHIDSIKRGDRIVLEMPYATVFYRVQKTEIVDPTDTWVVRDVGYERLVLSACNPLYSAAQRFIVFARAVRRARPPGPLLAPPPWGAAVRGDLRGVPTAADHDDQQVGDDQAEDQPEQDSDREIGLAAPPRGERTAELPATAVRSFGRSAIAPGRVGGKEPKDIGGERVALSPYHLPMASSTRKPLLAVGNEAEWAAINREEDEQRRAASRALTPSERIERGQTLSKRAVALLPPLSEPAMSQDEPTGPTPAPRRKSPHR